MGLTIPLSLAADGGLDVAVALSLFTDGRAGAKDLLPDGRRGQDGDRRGWWGDAVPPQATTKTASGGTQTASLRGWETGSLLWLLAREKQTAETARRAKDYAEQALRWLTKGGHVQALNVDSRWIAQGTLLLTVTLTLDSQKKVLSYQYRPSISSLS